MRAVPGDPAYADLDVPDDGHVWLQVRARALDDLRRFIAEYQKLFPDDRSPEIVRLVGHDYPVRALMRRDRFADLLRYRALAIDWCNVKSETLKWIKTPEERRVRGRALHGAWSAMLHLEALDRAKG